MLPFKGEDVGFRQWRQCSPEPYPTLECRQLGNYLMVGETSPLQCAGINRHEAEEEEASRERTSDPLGPEFCVRHREMHDEA